jgi:uncharacterized protein
VTGAVTTSPDQPAAAELRAFRSSQGAHLFVVDGSRIYDIDATTAAAIETATAGLAALGDLDDALLASIDLGPGTARRIDERPVVPPPVRSLSLNVAQACNMGCHYCYADEGKFGGRPRMMGRDVAEAAVARLVEGAEPDTPLLLGFMGGEPLVHRELVHHVTRHAAATAARAGRRLRFSITTNATLITPEDAALFAAYPFTVQVSLDGDRTVNDAQRPMRDGSGSYDRALGGVRTLQAVARPHRLVARVTVTPGSGSLLRILDHVIGLGFDDVGFAPVIVSPSPRHAFATEGLVCLLEGMIACGEKALAAWRTGRDYPFANLQTALGEIHHGTHRPYPCGAGAAYLSVSAEGGVFACHRLIDDAAFAMGDVTRGPDLQARQRHLRDRHVDRMEPCRTCWARYLCGGGCYHEVSRRGRPGCDYIRGWLEFCLRAYVELGGTRPEYFLTAAPEPWS